MIPVSSKVDKYKLQYQKSIDKYGICDNISFGYVFGEGKILGMTNIIKMYDELYICN